MRASQTPSKREVSRVGEEGHSQGRDRLSLRGRSRYAQTLLAQLLQATRRARHAQTKEGSWQETKAGREGHPSCSY
jgi:hypothetical protein